MKPRFQCMFLCCLFLFFFQIQSTAKVLNQIDIDQDQQQEIVVEDHYFRFIIRPSLGKIDSFVIKPSGTELLRDGEGRKERGALLADYIVQQGSFGDFMNQPYTAEILENSDTKAVVRLTRRGTTDLLQWITITKTITVFSDQPEIKVEYEVKNEQSSMEDYYLGLGIHNEFDSSNELVFSMPLCTGILHKKITVLTKSGTGEIFENIARGWVAISHENGGGIAFNFDYSVLKDFYEWHKMTLRSLAFSFLTRKIEPGKTFKTDFTILPYTRFIQVDGVVKKYACSIRTDAMPEKEKKVPVQVFLSGSNSPVDLKMVLVSLEGREQPISNISSNRSTDGLMVFRTEFVPQEEDLYVIKIIVQEGKEILGEFEKPIKLKDTG
ncbi:MAG TPA: DUF1926 domain-containing protein, partial [bacterium]|nr:DUF1926 domain-containing protein [bacterium]